MINMKKNGNNLGKQSAIVIGDWARPHSPRAFRLWGELAQPDDEPGPSPPAMPVTAPKKPDFPLGGTLMTLLGAGGTAMGIEELVRGGSGESVVASACILLPISLFFLYGGIMGIMEYMSCHRAYQQYKLTGGQNAN